MITYTLESWEDYYADTGEIWEAHYAEIAGDKRMPMNPDVAMYRTLEAAGMLQILVVREDGRMIGYMIFSVHAHGHYADILCGFEDAYFIYISHRKGGIGIKMIRESIRHLKARGVKRIFIHTKKSHDMSRLLEHLGMTHSDEIFSQWIGD